MDYSIICQIEPSPELVTEEQSHRFFYENI